MSVERLRRRLRELHAPAAALSPRQPVMLATLVDEPFSSPDWIFEIKYDGVRVLAHRAGRRVELYSRSGQPTTGRYPEVAEALEALPLERFLLDGEIVALDEGGRPSFQRLQARMGLSRSADVERMRARVPVSGVFFDALALDGHDLRKLPLADRKACLELVVPARGVVRYGDHVTGDGEAFHRAACERHLEGIVAKRRDSRYTGTRSRDWLKIKCQRRQEFVIGGYTDPQGARSHFGALHLGVYDGDRLVYVSKVGTGFDAKTLDAVRDRLARLGRPTSPFDVGTPTGRGHHWVEPKLVAEIRFTEWTDEGGLRHPAFLGLREDKQPTDCRREIPAPLPADAAAAKAKPARRRRGAPPEERHAPITHADKIFWPDDGYTKGDLVGYYESIAPLLLPYLRDRPLVLTRYPDGIDGKSFFQKDTPDFAPDWIRTARIHAPEAKRDIDYVVVDDVEALRWVVNLGTIPLHLWASRVGALERPDWLVIDLDPKGAPFAAVVTIALVLHRLLDELRALNYVKTSGKTGLHVLVPLGARYSYEQARALARLLATLAVEAEPAIATVARPLHERGGKVYVDWGQNGHGQTIVAPFSVRPLPRAPVSCPLDWDEVTPRLDPARFTITSAPKRFAARPDPLAPVLTETIDLGAVLARVKRDHPPA